MSEQFNKNKLYSLEDLHFFFSKNIISPYSYILTLIEKTKQYNSKYNIYISFHQNLARLDRNKFNLKYENKSFNVLNSIPYNIKDSFLTDTFETTYGVNRNSIPIVKKNSLIVELFQKEGAFLIGKTNLPAYANDVQTFNEITGITSNPWNMDYSAGGSTGGGAVSVAMGLVPIAIGSDFAGSVRIPAHYCGVKAYIPSNGHKYLTGHYPDFLDKENYEFIVGQIGFLSNFLDDFKHLYGILNSNIVEKENFDREAFTYNITLQDDYMPVSEEVKYCIQKIIQVLDKEGLKTSFESPKGFNLREVGHLHVELMKNTFNRKIDDHAQILTDLKSRKKHFITELNLFLRNKFWILPVTPTSAIKHNLDHQPVTIKSKHVSYWRAMIHYTRPFNAVNNPIITLPVGKSNSGLPIGIQIIAEEGKDIPLIQFAEFLEKEIGSIGYPPGFGLTS